MKLTSLFLIAVLMPIVAFSTETAHTSAASNELAITQVYVDDTSVMIIGRNLLNGPWDRKVKLGEFGLLTIVGTPTDTLIEAALPEGITPGDYLLIVAGALKDKHNDTYNLTIGSVGPAGPAGADGEPGAQGVQGKLGPAGADGTTGAQGEQGKIGPTGEDGAKGRQGEQGKIGPTGADGAMGERGKRGNRGYTGEDGAVGAQGVQGKIGPTGADGAEGAQGVQGKIGPVGANGAVGAQGVQGKIGPTGADGAVGAQGTQGKIGPVGADGAVGAQGEQGKIGPAGADGTTGVQGEQGKLGPAGSDGAMGAQGVQGKIGAAGGDGAMGAQGEQGKIGPQGDPGNLALANMSCPAGEFLTGFGPTGNLICASPPSVCNDRVCLTGTPDPATVFDSIEVTYYYPNNLSNGIWHGPSDKIIAGDYLENGYWSHPAFSGGYPALPDNDTGVGYKWMVHMPSTNSVVRAGNVGGVNAPQYSDLGIGTIDPVSGALSGFSTVSFGDGYTGSINGISSSATEFMIFDGVSIRRYLTTSGSNVLTPNGVVTLSSVPFTACNPNCYSGTFAWDGVYFYFAEHGTSSTSFLNYYVYDESGALVSTNSFSNSGGVNGVYFDWSVGRYATHSGFGTYGGGSQFTYASGFFGGDSQAYHTVSPAHTVSP